MKKNRNILRASTRENWVEQRAYLTPDVGSKTVLKVILVLLALSCLKCSSQNNSAVWLPENYVKAALARDTNVRKYLRPVEAFQSPFKNGFVLTYGGEINPLNLKRVTVQGKEKFELPASLYSYFNMQVHSREFVNRMKEAKFYLSKSGNKLLLEIIEKDQKQEIHFIDRINGYVFKGILEAEEYLEKK